MKRKLNDYAYIKKVKHISSLYIQNYFVLIDNVENSLYCFSNDLSYIWDDLTEGIFVKDIIMKYTFSDKEKDEIKKSLKFLLELGIISIDTEICIDRKVVKKNNQLDNFIIDCGKKGIRCKLFIETTSKCNLNCIHCFQDIKKVSLDIEKIVKVLEEAKKEGYFYITLTGGEIFLIQEWKKMISEIKKIGYVFSIISNLNVLSEGDILYLKKMHPERIKTSIYGKCAETHDKITGVKGSFEKTLNNIKRLLDNGIKVDVNYMVMNQNYLELKEMKETLIKMGCNVECSYKIYPTRMKKTENLNYKVGKKELLELIEKKLIQPQGGKCNAGQYELRIDPLGNVYPCAFLNLLVGNIYENNFADINRGERLQKIIEEVKLYFPKECRACENKEYCTLCPALMWNEKAFINKHHPLLCEYSNIN